MAVSLQRAGISRGSLGMHLLAAPTPAPRPGKEESKDGRWKAGSALRSAESAVAENAAEGDPHAVQGDLEDAAQTAHHVVALAGLAPAEPRIGA